MSTYLAFFASSSAIFSRHNISHNQRVKKGGYGGNFLGKLHLKNFLPCLPFLSTSGWMEMVAKNQLWGQIQSFLFLNCTPHWSHKHMNLLRKIWNHLASSYNQDNTHEESILGSAYAIVGPIKVFNDKGAQ